MSSSSQNPPVPPATEQPRFTPGPWHYSEPVASHRKPFVYDQNGNLVANFDGWVGRTYEENVANAKLGAAAPDLHAACQLVLDTMNERPGMGDAWYAPFREAVSAALAKAGVA